MTADLPISDDSSDLSRESTGSAPEPASARTFSAATPPPPRRPIASSRVRTIGVVVVALATSVALATTAQARARVSPESMADDLETTSATPAAEESSNSSRSGIKIYPLCVVGSWKLRKDNFKIQFFSDVSSKIPFSSRGGIVIVFRPNGKGSMTYKNYVSTGSYQGLALSSKINGAEQFNWTATNTTIDYRYTKVSRRIVTSVGSQSDTSTDHETKDRNGYTTIKCTGNVLTEKYGDGTVTWVRTDEYGVY
jgi:hypothetical protein